MNMFKPTHAWLIVACLLNLSCPLSALAGNEFIAVAYHDVVDHRHELTYDAVTLNNLIDHFEWIKSSGYQPVSIDDIKAARAGIRPLPEKAILLCWDDAYTSFYTHVLPLLKAYNYPAVLALVGSWMAPGPDEMVQYGEEQVSRHKFMTWQQLKEAADSGLVEIASHSYNLHTAVLADQSGDKLPAAIAHIYNPATGTYETDKEFEQRIRKDLQAGSDLIQQHLGFRPQVLVWPFGQYNEVALKIAAEVGMEITLTLNPVAGDIDRFQTIGRLYPTRNPDLKALRIDLESWKRPPVTHFFRVDSRNLVEPTPGQEHNFSIFLDRVKDLDPDMVIIDPTVVDDGRRKALFVNSRYPIIQDRLQRICWHSEKRADAPILLWLSPPLFSLERGETAATVNRFFSDMGKSAPGEGGLVVDNPELVRALIQMADSDSYQKQNIQNWNPEKQRRQRQTMAAKASTLQLSGPLQALEAFQQWQPFKRVGLALSIDLFRNIELKQFNVLFNFFDFLIIDMGNNSVKTLRRTIGYQLDILNDAGFLKKCAFMLSSGHLDNGLSRELQLFPSHQIINWGYQFDRFLAGSPAPDVIRPLLSKRSFPYPLRKH